MSARRSLLSAAVMILIYLLFLTPVLVLCRLCPFGALEFSRSATRSFQQTGPSSFLRTEPQAGLFPALGSSLLYSLATVLFTFLISVSPARVLARYEFRSRAVVEAFLLAPVLVPFHRLRHGGSLYLFIRAGLIDSFPGVVLVLGMFSYPYMLRSLTAGFGALPKELWICATQISARGPCG